MDNNIKEIETEIIKKFVKKEKQNRILWELSSSKHRKKVVLNRFHEPSLFKKDCMKKTDYLDKKELHEILLDLGKNHKVYYLGENEIGYMLLDEAVEHAFNNMICLIYCGNGIGYFQGEEGESTSAPPRIFLIEK